MTERVLGPKQSSRRRWTMIVPLVVALTLGLLYISGAQAVHDLGLFQLDRNAVDVGAGDDWNTPPRPTGSADDFTGILDDIGVNNPPGGAQFTGGGSKDDLDITQWLWKAGEPLDKDNITNAYAAAYTNTVDTGNNNIGDLIIYFGLDRFSTNGSAQVGFWFLQDPAFGLSNTASGGGFQFTGAHQDNDVLVQSNFSNGGVISTVTVYKWLAGNLVQVAEGGECIGAAADDAGCGTANQSPEPAPWDYTPKENEGPPGTFQASAFFEGGVNISRLIPAAGCFTNFMAETRSSTPFDATLKDFVTGNLDTCVRDVRVLKTPDDGQANAGDNISFTMNVKNIGNTTATNVMLTDNLPNSSLNWSITTQPAGDPCSITGAAGSQVLSCNFGSLAVDAEREVTISSPTTSASCGAKPNTVTVSSTGDIDTSNNSDTGQVTVSCPDVSVVKTPDGEAGPPGTITAGEAATFTMTITNNGPGVASNVTLSDNLPTANGLDWSIVSQGLGPGFTGGTSCTIDASDLLSCSIATLASGASYRVVVSSATTGSNCGTINNTVTISATGDINPANNSDPGSIVVQCAAIRILKQSTKSGNPLVSSAGTVFTVTPPAGAAFDVTDDETAAAPDEDPSKGEVCISGLAPGTYTIAEKTPPPGYGAGSAVDSTALAVGGTDCGSNQPTDANSAVFTNPPLGEITAGYNDGGSGETSATSITCAPQGDPNLTPQDEASDDDIPDYDLDKTFTVTAPGTYVCTVVVDP
jgi:uncharacterized repeat protein (TIGR01451 family)